MSQPTSDRLLELLPVIYQMRDAELGQPFRALLQVITEQVNLLQADIDQLYDNWFLETCQDWVVPYVGDLIGYRPLQGAFQDESGAAAERELRTRALFPRRDVAHTIGYRRRKGTLGLLDQLALDVAGWPARAVEFYAHLRVAQSINHLRLRRGRTVDLRDGDALDRLRASLGAFDHIAHTVSVPRINSVRARSRYNIPSIGVFVWRLKPYSITRAPAFCIDRARNHYTFNVLGITTALITHPEPEPALEQVPEEMNVPAWIRRRGLEERTADYYGRAKSILIWRDGLDQPVPVDNIVAADLSAWVYRPQRSQVAVDPVLGRIAFSARNPPLTGVWVTYYYGFSDDMGGGEYPRRLCPAGGRRLYRVGPGEQDETIMGALRRWQEEKRADASKRDAVIEISDSGEYHEEIEIVLEDHDRLELRAADRVRPVLRLLDRYSNRSDALRVRGVQAPVLSPPVAPHPPRLLLDGLLITTRSIQIDGAIREVKIRHCTLVPGWSLDQDCSPREEEPSIELFNTSANLTVERSVIGSIRVNESEVATDPIVVSLSDSILDATGSGIDALSAPDNRHAYCILSLVRCTVFGIVRAHAIRLAQNSILRDRIRVARRQTGCVRFCYVGPDSRTPRRFHCQPDRVLAAVQDDFLNGTITAEQRDAAQARERLRVQPQFNSTLYGTPTYCQLARTCAVEITTGADDESEMGAFHDLFQPQREANLRTRLADFTPAGMDVGIEFVT